MITTNSNQEVMLTDTSYDVSKKLVQLWLPAISALYFGLASIWGLPAPDKVVGTIAVFTTFLGVVLNVSHNRYKQSDEAYDGKLVVTQREDRTVASLELNDEASVLTNNESIKFKVVEGTPPPEIIDEVVKEDDEDPEV
jgi:hypothetical protein